MAIGQAKFGLLGGVDLGSLELIQTQDVSAVSDIEFTSIQENVYNVHFLVFALTNVTNVLNLRISNNGGTSFIASGYERALFFGSVTGSFGEDRSTSATSLLTFGSSSSGREKNGYVYLYGLGDNTKFSFATEHSMNNHSSLGYYMGFASGQLDVAATHNAIQLEGGTGTLTGVASLYGIRES
jgi:hypothetical protein